MADTIINKPFPVKVIPYKKIGIPLLVKYKFAGTIYNMNVFLSGMGVEAKPIP